MPLLPARDVPTAAVAPLRGLVGQCLPCQRIGIRRRRGPSLSDIRWAPLPLLLLEIVHRPMVLLLLLRLHPLVMADMAVEEIGSSREDVVVEVAVEEDGAEEAEVDMTEVGATGVAEIGSREVVEAGAGEVDTVGATTLAEAAMMLVEVVGGGALKAAEPEVTGTREVAVDG